MIDRVLVRYLILQVPGWVLAVVVLWLLRQWIDLSAWMMGGVLGLLLLKDAVIYPFVRSSYANDARHGTDLLVGLRGVAAETFSTSGYVRVRGELWRAEAAEPGDPIPEGAPVIVESARGLTLRVRGEH